MAWNHAVSSVYWSYDGNAIIFISMCLYNNLSWNPIPFDADKTMYERCKKKTKNIEMCQMVWKNQCEMIIHELDDRYTQKTNST